MLSYPKPSRKNYVSREHISKASLCGRCPALSVLQLHNSRAGAEPDLINEFITGTRGSHASNAEKEGGFPMELKPVLLSYRPGEERRS